MVKKVDAVVVTYNRLGLLKKCLKAIINQTYEITNLFVIDNNSTDDTTLYLRQLSRKYSCIQPVYLSKNIGGAGGFYEGLKKYINNSDSDFVWIMDDDTIPSPTALEDLILKTNKVSNLGFLASNVRWIDGSPAVMNIPQPIVEWNKNIKYGLVGIEYASFVSILFPRNVIFKVGLPIKDYFIWGDDVEFTKRITQKGFSGFMVINSVVKHEIKQNIGTNIILEKSPTRIKRYYYARRNTMYTMKKRYGKKDLLKWIIYSMLIEPVKIVTSAKDQKLLRLKSSLKGTIIGLVYHPTIYKFKSK